MSGSIAGGAQYPSLTVLTSDDPFSVEGVSTTLKREFAIQAYSTFTGQVPARETFVIDKAGYVRAVHVDQKDGTTHAGAALEALAALGQDALQAEREFGEQAVVGKDGQLERPRMLSAVGRMREKQAQAAAARGDAGGDNWTATLNKWFEDFMTEK